MSKKNSPSEAGRTRTIMGVDPGTNRTGYGVIEVCGGDYRCVALGCIELGGIKDPYEKLHEIFERVGALIDRYRPDEVALEAPFYGRNVQSMLKLGRAQGVAMAAALHRGLPVSEYAPRRVKQSITGQGAAPKMQVALVLRSMLGMEFDSARLDATDALAVALCHWFAVSSPLGRPAGASRRTGRSAGWEAFLSANPDRIVEPKHIEPEK